MSKTMAVFVATALVLAVTFGAAAADKSCPAGKAAADAKCCPKCAKTCDVTVKGKIETKTEKVDGKDTQVAYVTVSEAKTTDGKAMCCMAGKALKVTGDKACDVQKMCGKEVEMKGTCKEGKEFTVTSLGK